MAERFLPQVQETLCVNELSLVEWDTDLEVQEELEFHRG